MSRKGNSTNVDLAETEPGKDDGQRDDTLQPECSAVLASVGKLLPGLAPIVDEENNLSPDQSQSGPSEEPMGPLEGIVEFGAYGGVGEHNHHQE